MTKTRRERKMKMRMRMKKTRLLLLLCLKSRKPRVEVATIVLCFEDKEIRERDQGHSMLGPPTPQNHLGVVLLIGNRQRQKQKRRLVQRLRRCSPNCEAHAEWSRMVGSRAESANP